MSRESHRQEPEIVDGEIVAEYSETVLNLPPILEEDGKMDEPAPEEIVADPGRRGFVLRLLLGGAAAAAVGGSAALLYQQYRPRGPRIVVVPNGTPLDSTDTSALVAQIGEIDAALQAMTADRDRLLAELADANADLVELRAQLDDAVAQIERYRALNNLWQRLDDIGLDELLETALGVIGGALAGVMTVVRLLRAGLAAGQRAIDNFTALLPGPQDGILWLQRQVSALAASLEWLSEQVQEAVQPVEPFANLIASFVLWVLDHLPFGFGAKARAGLEAMQSIITGLPDLIAGVNEDVLDPLAEWFGQDEARSLAGILLKPITESVFAPAQDVLDKVAEFETTYKQELTEPAQEALAQRAELRGEIHQAQARLGLRV